MNDHGGRDADEPASRRGACLAALVGVDASKLDVTGWAPSDDFVRCATCEGSGRGAERRCGRCQSWGCDHDPCPDCAGEGSHPLLLDPREAAEILQTRGLAPAGDAPRWWCIPCQGSGGFWRKTHTEHGDDWGVCAACEDGVAAAPPDLATLVAVASLGVGRWLRAEALAQEASGAERVAWRAMTRGDLVDAHSNNRGDGTGAPLLLRAFAFECFFEAQGHPFEQSPFCRDLAVRSAWPAVLDLRGLGVHLVGLSDAVATLAVALREALPRFHRGASAPRATAQRHTAN